MSRYVGRENLRKRLIPLENAAGRTSYAGGLVRIALESGEVVVRPPFGLPHEGEYETVRLEPLFDALAANHVVAAVLVRLGGYAVGVFDGERLVTAKVGARFVKGRHKKGGSSANRFRRRREEQARALVEEAAEAAVATLEPWRSRIDFVVLGGDRRAIAAVLAADPRLAWVREREVSRFLPVREPRRQVLEDLPYSLYSAEVTETQSST